MHASIKSTKKQCAEKMKEGLRERVNTERKALCLGRAVPNVPWGFGAISCPHKQ